MDPDWFKFSSSFNYGIYSSWLLWRGVLPDMGAHLDTRKEHQATWELWEAPISLGTWEVSLYGGGGGRSFSWLPVSNTICLVGSLLGHTTIPYL